MNTFVLKTPERLLFLKELVNGDFRVCFSAATAMHFETESSASEYLNQYRDIKNSFQPEKVFICQDHIFCHCKETPDGKA